MTIEKRQCPECRSLKLYTVYPPQDTCNLGPQDICPGCAVRRREDREEHARYYAGILPEIGRRGTLARHEALTREITDHGKEV